MAAAAAASPCYAGLKLTTEASDVDECARITRWLGELPSGGTPWLGQKPRRTVSWSGGIQPQHRNLHDFAE